MNSMISGKVDINRYLLLDERTRLLQRVTEDMTITPLVCAAMHISRNLPRDASISALLHLVHMYVTPAWLFDEFSIWS